MTTKISQLHHEARTPFPKDLPDGRTIIDEVCKCGSNRSAHRDTLQYGHGAMPDRSCLKFTISSFVFKD